MRNNVFYWKCDSPIPSQEKIAHFFNNKYTPEVREAVGGALHDFLGHSPESLVILKSDGNHLVAKFSDKGTDYFFRADEGRVTDDVYLLAESTVMNLLNKQGLPVPPVYHTDITLKRYPFRFQIMEFIRFPCLNKFAKENTLDEKTIASQSGHFLAQIHAMHFPGFGFFDTDKLSADGTMKGLDASAGDYFRKCLDKHLAYLTVHELLLPEKELRIITAFDKAVPLLNSVKGSLLHRDYAYWNILGTENEIKRVIDWDDSVSGDPADDFGIISCFLSDELVNIILKSYTEHTGVDDSFRTRIHLHCLRNMLWKTVIRHSLGYFDKGKEFFLSMNNGTSLRDYTLRKIDIELEKLENAL
ncbi:MAG: Phosphotransferase enzyme family protein [Lentisphaerae bacterium ADurb.Bin242]|nr:MAG: Phosphotransferase enzyme family protein [Lentisphaerae bacterium ADurb.Bin242]